MAEPYVPLNKILDTLELRYVELFVIPLTLNIDQAIITQATVWATNSRWAKKNILFTSTISIKCFVLMLEAWEQTLNE